MPSYSRSQIVTAGQVGFYHCVARCVRRAYLCGADQATGKSFEHRKEWVESQLARLAKNMAVDVCGFAVMSNHVHLVVRIRPDVAASWSTEEVVRRWWKLFGGRRDDQVQAASPSAAERAALLADPERVETLRQRLISRAIPQAC